MYQKLLTILLVGMLTACASSPQTEMGNFVQTPVVAHEQKMVEDSVKKLLALYPPATTKFELQHIASDSFGVRLIESLRSKGYAIQEFIETPAPTANGAKPASTQGLPLSYILQQSKEDDDAYVLSFFIKQQRLGRLYKVKAGAVLSAGYWARKE